MSETFLGQIMMFAGNFAPSGWAFCDGRLLPISQNAALFSILGTTYGGNGVTTFALPDLRSRFPMHQGQGAGLSNYSLGETIGQEGVALTVAQLPSHTHIAKAGDFGDVVSPENAFWSTDPGGNTAAYSNSKDGTLNSQAIAVSGSDIPHDNMQPYLGINFVIAVVGIFPSRN